MTSRGIFCALAIALLYPTSAHAQQWDWVQRFSGDGAATAVAVDSNQNVYLAVSFKGTNQLGTNVFISAGGEDVLLLKLDPDGKLLWVINTGGTNDDRIQRMAVTDEDTIFVVGQFTIRPEHLAGALTNITRPTNVFVARVDEAKFTWIDGGAIGMGLNVLADGSLWVGGYNPLLFTRRYAQSDGARLNEFSFLRSEGLPAGRMAVDALGRAYVNTTVPPYFAIGTNTLNPTYVVAHVTAALDPEEGLRWFWSVGSGYPSHGTDIIVAPDGDVISAAYQQVPLPYRVGYVSRHTSDGIRRWGTSHITRYGKTFWTPTALSLAPNGNMHVGGGVFMCTSGYYLCTHLWLFTLDADGNKVSEQLLPSSAELFIPEAVTPTLAVAGDAEGAVYLAGKAPRNVTFGGRPSVGDFNAFVARRPTLEPTLHVEQSGTNLILSWPRAAYLFALQQSDGTGTNWSFVSQPPALVNRHWQVVLPREEATGLFRLLRTNDITLHAPRWTGLVGPDTSFLGHTNVVFTNMRLGFTARCEDLDSKPLAFVWTDVDSGASAMGVTNAIHVGRYVSPTGYPYPPFDEASLVQEPITYEPGFHTIQVIASDGVYSITNSWTFEVISEETALQEFFAAIEVLRADRLGRKALAFLDGYQRAKSKERENLAEKRWSHFQRQFARGTSLTEEERGRLSSAAEQVKSLLPAPSP